jgi:hypothetical protein
MSRLQKALEKIFSEIVLTKNFYEYEQKIKRILIETGYKENEIEYIIETIIELIEKGENLNIVDASKNIRVIADFEKVKMTKEALELLLNYYYSGSIENKTLENILNFLTFSNEYIDEKRMQNLIEEYSGFLNKNKSKIFIN